MIFGLILAGGRSRRFGSDKALATLGGVTLLARAHARLTQVCDVVAVSASDTSPISVAARALGSPVLPDPRGSPPGPLSGVLAGLEWAQGQGGGQLITLPCDAPLAPMDLEARLLDAIGDAPASVARTPDGMQPLCAVWRSWMIRPLGLALADGLHPPVHQVLSDANAVEVTFEDATAFLNINTTEDLAIAERRLR
ncbi:MAG: molybdenum cofactor guanylyltransferase [Phenylobacterium sp.]|uniref:molybdenum cofactor guanylyltransferase n=1 Tax=Phenylobacterium sp. TaxID=1871053 RepID=UPI00273447CF|nr:molybdenum cofactor guanylyltransferase [Phenylobacterium sp.]MDP3175480.1 molybdenum cofactor guanylyltransferase [Phenylobacterium sp.]